MGNALPSIVITFPYQRGVYVRKFSLFTDPALLYFTNIFNLWENSLNLQLILLSELSLSLLIQKTITCFEKSEGSGDLLDQDRFLLLKSATVDKVLICPDLDYQKLQDSIQNSAAAQKLSKEYPTEIQQLPEKCAFDIHKNCEKKIFDQVVVNHLSWPETTKWRQCYLKALLQTPCSALILQNYAALQEKFGESFRKKEFDLGLYGIFMNDHHLQSNGTVEIL